MTTLRASIESLANQFATGVLAAIRGASLQEILSEGGPAKRGPGRPPRSAVASPAAVRAPKPGKKGRIRRSTKDIARVAESIISLVGKHGKGIRGEQIRKELGIAKNHWMKPLGMALSSKKLRKTGQKRATLYFPSK
jgi:hypothetical protein